MYIGLQIKHCLVLSCLVLLELDIPFWLLQTIQILDKLIHGQKSFSRMHARHLVDLKPSRHSITSIVRSPQSTVLILYWPVWCSLHDVFEEPLTDFRLVSRLLIATDRDVLEGKNLVFPHQKVPFSLIFKIWNWHGLRTLADVRYFIWKWTEIFLEA